jgi:hypothetical protein
MSARAEPIPVSWDAAGGSGTLRAMATERRADNVIGALAGLVAVTTIVVFGYLSIKTGGSLGWLGGTPSAPPEPRAPAVALAPIEEIVDQDYRFRLRGPDASWRVFDRAAADEAWFGVNAAMFGERAVAQLLITRVGDVPIAVATQILEEWAGPAHSKQPLQWLGYDAVELARGADPSAQRTRGFVRDGFLFRYSVTTYDAVKPLTDGELAAVWHALALLPGALAPRAFTPPPTDSRGMDWRVESGVWESALTEVAVTPPPGWRLATGRQLRDAGFNADVQLLDDTTGCGVALYQGRTITGEKDANAIEAEVGDAMRTLVHTGTGPWTEIWSVSLDAGRSSIMVNAWGPSAERDRTIASVRRALAAITPIGPDRVAAIAADLARAPHWPTVIGPDWVIRGSTFAHYGQGITWQRPDQGVAWRVFGGDVAAEYVGGAVLVGEGDRGVMFAAAPDPDLAVQGAAGWLEDQFDGRAKRVDLTPVRADLTDGAAITVAKTFVHELGILGGQGRTPLGVHVWGERAAVRESTASLADALQDLTLAPVESVTRALGRYTNRRWGVDLNFPGTGWISEHEQDGEAFLEAQWTLNGDELVGIFVDSQGSRTSPVTIAAARQTASAAVSRGAAFTTERGNDTLGGEPATRLSWKEGSIFVAVLIAEHDELVYRVYVRGTVQTLDTARLAFRFVGPS